MGTCIRISQFQNHIFLPFGVVFSIEKKRIPIIQGCVAPSLVILLVKNKNCHAVVIRYIAFLSSPGSEAIGLTSHYPLHFHLRLAKKNFSNLRKYWGGGGGVQFDRILFNEIDKLLNLQYAV